MYIIVGCLSANEVWFIFVLFYYHGNFLLVWKIQHTLSSISLKKYSIYTNLYKAINDIKHINIKTIKIKNVFLREGS